MSENPDARHVADQQALIDATVRAFPYAAMTRMALAQADDLLAASKYWRGAEEEID